MAASGLTPDTNMPDMSHITALADFAFAIRTQLEYVNQHSFNNFKLRIGKFIILMENGNKFFFLKKTQVLGVVFCLSCSGKFTLFYLRSKIKN